MNIALNNLRFNLCFCQTLKYDSNRKRRRNAYLYTTRLANDYTYTVFNTSQPYPLLPSDII